MARRNNSRKLPNRPRYLPMIGDPSPLPSAPYTDELPIRAILDATANGADIDEQLENMSPEEILSLALALGAKATDLLGVQKCVEHMRMKEFVGVVSSVRYSIDVVWCHGCFTYYRYPS